MAQTMTVTVMMLKHERQNNQDTLSSTINPKVDLLSNYDAHNLSILERDSIWCSAQVNAWDIYPPIH